MLTIQTFLLELFCFVENYNMILLIDKNCPFCEELKDLDKKYSDIKKLFVTDGMIEEINKPVDKKIPGLPALIVGEKEKTFVYVGNKYILDFLRELDKNKQE